MTERAVIEPHLRGGVRLSKVQTLLRRQGVVVSCATLRCFAVAELGSAGRRPRSLWPTAGPGKRSKSAPAG